jgi:hypothetical protein
MGLTTKLTTNGADNREATWTVVHRRPGETTGADRNGQAGESYSRNSCVKAYIGLAVPGRPIGPWSRRTGAPQASATRRDRDPDAQEVAHGTRHDTPG